MSVPVREPEESAVLPPQAVISDRPLPRKRGKMVSKKAAAGVGVLAFAAGLGTMWLAVGRNATFNDAVFAVNGTPLRRDAFTHRLEAAAGTPVVRQMLAEELKLQFAHKTGAEPTDAEVNARYAAQSAQPGFFANLTAHGQTPDDAKRAIRLSMAEFRALTKGVSVSDDETRAYYKAQSDPRNPNAHYYTPAAVNLAVIVSDREADIKNALHDLASGASFAQAAARYSKDQSKTNGGIVQPIVRGRVDKSKLPGLEEAAFQLSAGQQADAVKIAGAWWILRCVGKTPEKSVAFEQVRDECHDAALLLKGTQVNGKQVETDFAAFRQSARVEAFWPQYKNVIEAK